MVERGSGGGVSLSEERRSLSGDPEGYVENALEMGISFHRGTCKRAHLPGTLRDG